MSVIAVKRYKDKIIIGCDSQVTKGDDKNIDSSFTKLTKINKNFIIGSAGYAKIHSLLVLFCETTLPKNNDQVEIIRFFNNFNSWLKKEISEDLDHSTNSFIFVLNKKVFTFYDYNLVEVKKFDSIGSGDSKALAILSYGDITNQDVTIDECLQAVCKIDLYCHAPIITYTITI